MKHSAKAVLAVSMSVLWLSLAMGEEVSSDVAKDAARGWINLREALGEEITAEPESVLSYDAKDGKGKYYVVNLQGGGFVVTSGDAEIEPILAYSKDSTWNTNAAENPLMAMLNIDVAAMMAQLTGTTGVSPVGGGIRLSSSAVTTGTAVAPVNGQDARSPSDGKAAKWARLRGAASAKGGARLQGTKLNSIGDVRVKALLKTSWTQSGDRGENYYTPKNRVCGCIATGGSQILYYWKWPQSSITASKNYDGTIDDSLKWDINSGYETTAGGTRTAWSPPFGGTYNWTAMTSSDASVRKPAIGKLTRDVGLACYMSYAVGGSSANYQAFHLALTGQFGFKNSAIRFKTDGLPFNDIKNAILPSLDLKSPCAVTVPGHAIVADGYGYSDGTLYVHFNMGWNGTGNAWYNPPDLTAAHSDFKSIKTIVYNIYPPTLRNTAGLTVVSGRVLDDSRRPVQNVTVTARAGTSTRDTATTDENGIYALLVPKNTTYSICAEHNDLSATTNVTVSNWASANITSARSGSSFSYTTTGSVGNVHGVELTFSQLPAPTFSPAAMTFVADSLDVTLACATAGATIRYTLDGSEPTSSSVAYSAPITITATTTIKAKAFKSGYVASDTVSATYTIAERVAMPTSTSTPGYRTTLVDLASTVPGAVIRYTVDGSDPTEQSEVYTAGTAINVTNATGATTIKARAYAEGYRPSDVFSYDYYVKQFFGPTNGANVATWEDTPENRAAHWVHEDENFKEATGLWSNAVEYVNHKVAIDERNEFTADNPSDARNVIIETTLSFDGAAEEHEDYDGAKAAIRIGTNSCFQVYTTNANGRVWLDTEGASAETNRDYIVRLELDFTNKTYTIAVRNGSEYATLYDGAVTNFPFAYSDGAPYVQAFEFDGEGSVGSIYGSYTNRVVVFVTDEVVTVSDGTTTLTASQAEWLNKRGDHAAVAAVIRTLTSDQFARAYLLNENIMNASYSVDGWGSFEITDIDVGASAVTVKVKLVRNFAVMDGAEKAPINGTLKVYGGANVSGINTQIQDYELNDNDVHFRDGEEATFIIDKGAIKFYKATIE